MSAESQVHSMLIAIDGESKCGKTTFAEMIAQEAEYQAGVYRGEEHAHMFSDARVYDDFKAGIADWASSINFKQITTLSAGNVFRAAAYYVMEKERAGKTVTSFAPSDTDELRRLLAGDGIIDFLQSDAEVGKRVSPTAKFAGAQALCGAIFCDDILKTYEFEGGSNLVIADARDPIGHLRRNNLLGDGQGMILPASIVPLYIDTPVEAAALPVRMKGNYEDNLALVRSRRHDDATRKELPVARPKVLNDDISDWLRHLPHTAEGYIPTHFLAENNENITLSNIQYIGGVVAQVTQLNAWYINNPVPALTS